MTTIHHHPAAATGQDWRRTKRPYKMAIHTLQDTFTSWDEHFIRHCPGQCVPDGPPAEFERRHRIISVFFGFDPEFVEERSLHLFCFGWLPLMSVVAQCRSPSTGSCYDIRRYFLTWVFVFLLSLIVACCLVFVKTSLQACVAGCFHLQWHSLFVCLYGWSLSAPSAPSCLRFPLPPKDKKTKGKITCTATRNKPTCSKPEICKSKASFPADLLSPCHTPVSKSIRQHHVEHHTQNHPSASSMPRPKAHKTLP